ncbi:uncharacterized protein LOC129755490 [Uranotaenia lowii]|uniref:uncharacterized protein LOC129755490 n=1 Tax=Uranotaenia lowii TaxID=190385 RepID=UPI002479EBD6|nr:uncharacterized protein LOC129755490 [Uranotaenia lowii]
MNIGPEQPVLLHHQLQNITLAEEPHLVPQPRLRQPTSTAAYRTAITTTSVNSSTTKSNIRHSSEALICITARFPAEETINAAAATILVCTARNESVQQQQRPVQHLPRGVNFLFPQQKRTRRRLENRSSLTKSFAQPVIAQANGTSIENNKNSRWW